MFFIQQNLFHVSFKVGLHYTFICQFSFQVVERRKQIEIEEQEIARKEKELMSAMKLPAEAEAYKVDEQVISWPLGWSSQDCGEKEEIRGHRGLLPNSTHTLCQCEFLPTHWQ